MNNTFEDYVDRCRTNVNRLLSPGRGFYQYIRDKRGRAKGVITLYKQEGELKIGWSLCNKLDQFNKLVGLNKALERSINVDDVLSRPPEIPHTVKPLFERMLNRAKRLQEAQQS